MIGKKGVKLAPTAQSLLKFTFRLAPFFSSTFSILVAVALTRGFSAEPECQLQNSPTGLHGVKHSQDYRFEHLSDTNGQLSKITYFHCIKNTHPTALLSARWDKAGMEFQFIQNGQCASNSFDTFIGAVEDPDSPILFGTGSRYEKPASAYVRQSPAQVVKLKVAPLLNSSIGGKLSDHEAPVNLGLRTHSSIEGPTFTYIFQNFGDELILQMPGFSAHWARFGKPEIPQWNTAKDELSLKRGENWKFSNPAEVENFTERLFSVSILSPKAGTVIARGQVSLYLPEKAIIK